jgi:phosphatidylserine/phosphatidylglycerophosphate/cardiolipin synthase-like enzyme
LLAGCHNKGIIVDSRAVLLSSQNYSADGVRFNRDAGLIIYDPKVAGYFEEIFLYDWESRAMQKVAGETGAMPLIRTLAETGPVRTRAMGRTRVIAWNQFYEE